VGAESFTVLAILEARDRASEIFAKVDKSLGKFKESATSAAETAKAAGDTIDESLLKTASGADALDVASARVDAAQEKAARTAEAQAEAERGLVEAHKAAAGAADDDAASQYRLMEADQRLTAAAKENTAAQKTLSAAQKTQADTAAAAAAKSDAAAAGQKKVAEESKASAISLGSVGKVAGIMALGLGVAGALMIKAAGNFQDSTTHLVTDAGESAKNLAMVQAGILQVSTATGTSASDITNAMYHIESGGYHGASGLKLLQVAAEGARVGGADLDTVSKTLVGTMNAYGLSSGHATSFMNQLIATVGQGDMRMQDLASSLSAVAPLAAKVGLQFSQVGGAIATMTAQGMSARQATQDLANTIRNMSNPNNVAIHEMQAMGLSSQDVAQHLGQRGLTGTITMLTTAITSHMGKSGMVIQSAFASATSAAKDANIMISAMPRGLQAAAKGFLSGSVSSKAWKTELAGMSPVQAHLMTQFAGTAEKAHSFNSLLASGSPAAQTYTAALAKMMGGATGLNTALMLTGTNAAVFAKNAALIAAKGKDAGSSVDNWSTIQGTFNFKLESAKTGVENTGIAIGSALLPAATSLLSVITSIVEPIAEWTAKHRTLTEIIFGTVTAIAATVAIIAVASKAFKAVTGAVDTVKATMKALGLISKETAATEAGAAAESSGSWVASAATTMGAWAAAAASGIASAARWVAGQAVKVATVVASNVAGAAAAAAAWLASAASGVAGAALWVAGSIAKVAVVVAGNVAGAAVTMAAWIVANAAMLLGIGLIVVAVVAAVALIVTHWKQISAFAAKAFHEVLAVVDSVIGWVKAHWPLLLAILTGPFGLAVLFIIDHYHQVLAVIDSVISWVEAHWPLLLAILTGPVGLAVLWIVNHFDQIRDGAAHLIGQLVSFFESLPGRILSALGNLGSMLFGSGATIIQGLINGVMSMVGSIGHAIGSVVSTIKSYLPFSPAKQGPLSGAGDPSYSGRSIAKNLAKGLLAGTGDVAGASHLLAGAVTFGRGGGLPGAGGGLTALGGSGGGGAGGSLTLTLDLRGAVITSDQAMNTLAAKVGAAVVRQLAPAGVHVRMG
jgi:hypothetical protein